MELTKEQFLQDFKDILHEEQLIKVEDATPTELFQTLARTIRKYITPMSVSYTHLTLPTN